MPETNWNVITAAPSSGKTSTLRALSGRGWHTLPEASRMVIDHHVSKGMDAEKVREKTPFQETVIELNKKMEREALNDLPLFLDRSLADNLVYMAYPEKEFPEVDFIDDVRDKYANIFLLERLPYEDDYARQEDEQEAEELQEWFRWGYSELGYSVIEVPLMPIPDRVDLIERHVTRE